jgi:hypothetical protein
VTCAPARSRARVRPPGPGADFQHLGALKLARDRGDTVEQVLVEQEVLAQRLAGRQAMAGDHFAQGRECRGGFHQ